MNSAHPPHPKPIRRKALLNSNPASPQSKLHLLQLVRSRPSALRSPESSPYNSVVKTNSLQVSPKRGKELLHFNSTHLIKPSHLPGSLQPLSLTERSQRSPPPSLFSSRNLSPTSVQPNLDSVLPASSTHILSLLSSTLSPQEKEELSQITQVYYIGTAQTRVRGPPVDDSKGHYPLYPNDHLFYRYEVLNILGKGSFGQVVRCFDHKKQEPVAIKVLRARDRLKAQGLIEIKALNLIKKRDFEDKMPILRIKSAFEFRQHLCIVTEILGVSLYETLKNSGFSGFHMPTIRKIMKEVTTAVAFTHNLHIIHCDVKPDNVLFRLNGPKIRLIDYGSCCFEDKKIYTYIQSRFYRAPEIILGLEYTQAIDMWSVGCVAAELCRGKPLLSGENEQQQISMITDLLGLPPAHIADSGSRAHIYFRHTVDGLKLINTKKPSAMSGLTLQNALKTADAECIDFISRCLQWDPSLRMTSQQALSHPWLSEI